MDMSKSRWYSQLYVQVLIGFVFGAAIGHFEPQFGAKLQPFADGFIKLIKMLLAPIIFGTVVVGIAKMGSIKEVGRIGVKSLLYFEVLSTIALVIGLLQQRQGLTVEQVGMRVDAYLQRLRGQWQQRSQQRGQASHKAHRQTPWVARYGWTASVFMAVKRAPRANRNDDVF